MRRISLSLFFFIIFFLPISSSWGDKLSTTETQPTVVAPASLAQREQSSLQKQYKYEVRQKALLLTPYASSLSSSDIGSLSMDGEQSEEEKLYRYFGIAMNLAKEGRLGISRLLAMTAFTLCSTPYALPPP